MSVEKIQPTGGTQLQANKWFAIYDLERVILPPDRSFGDESIYSTGYLVTADTENDLSNYMLTGINLPYNPDND